LQRELGALELTQIVYQWDFRGTPQLHFEGKGCVNSNKKQKQNEHDNNGCGHYLGELVFQF
jgi:hypothetical protein